MTTRVVKLTAQRISTISFSTTGLGATSEYRKRSFRYSADDDNDHRFGPTRRVTRVEIVSATPEEYRPTAVNQMEKVKAIITETWQEEV